MDSTTGTRGARAQRTARLLPGLTAGLALALLTACGSSTDGDPTGGPGTTDESQPPTVVSEASLLAGDRVPVPSGKTVLTITGKVAGDNQGSSVALDLATLATLEVVRVELYEPWAKKRLTFRGVDLLEVLDVAGVDPDASSVHMTALDDYEVDLTMDEVRAGGVLLATETGDGGALAIDKGGPVRIVFRDGVDAGVAAEQWIWSLKTIDVR